MSTDFQYSTDFYGMNARELSHTCMHLLCLAGEASFVFNEHCYHSIKNDLVVIPMPDRVRNLAGHTDLQVEWFAADYKCRLAGGVVCCRLQVPAEPAAIEQLQHRWQYLAEPRPHHQTDG